MRFFVSVLALFVLVTAPVFAQSLNIKSPAPLHAGLNTGTIDNMVGNHYYSVTGGPGPFHMKASFVPMGLLGNAYNTTITVTISDEARSWSTPKNLTSDRQQAEVNFDANLKAPTKMIVTVSAMKGLIRTGGDYTLECTGAVTYGQASTGDPVVGMYKQMSGYVNLQGDCKFSADGSIVTTNGGSGHWKLFDKDSQTYVVEIAGEERKSLKLVPARGLMDNDAVVFQCR